MSAIKSSHNLLEHGLLEHGLLEHGLLEHGLLEHGDGRPERDDGISAASGLHRQGRGQSRYTYLFRDLADDPRVGCFSGTTAQETVARLHEFEVACRIPLSTPAELRMRLPAAYTYFGQFVNHDISAPVGDVLAGSPVPVPAGVIGAVDPPGLDREQRGASATILDRLINEHATPLALASLYEDGPSSPNPEVRALFTADGLRFRLASTSVAPDSLFTNALISPGNVRHAAGARDIPRKNRKPQIADHRNDQNLVVSQLHLALMLFHNKVVGALKPRFPDRAERFREARQLVTLHYHWLILNDYLPSLLSKSVVQQPLANWPSRPADPVGVPLEFTTAAFRFGHSMVGSAYDFNANFGVDGKISPDGASLKQLFDFTTHGNMQSRNRKTLQLPDHWVIDWDRMTTVPGPAASRDRALPGAEPIDMNFAREMLTIVGDSGVAVHGSILFRNLMRGFHRRIPFGQRLAQKYSVKVLGEDELRQALPGDLPDAAGGDALRKVAQKLGFLKETPAWLYFLCESKAREGGQRLGATASHIIADTIVGLMRRNPDSVLNYRDGTWHPRDSVLTGNASGGLTSIREFLIFAVKDTRRPSAG
jgi:Animal haem peroxidase